MSLSFKEYVTISKAIAENQLDEGFIQDAIEAIKKRLGANATDEKIRAEIEKLKKQNPTFKKKADDEAAAAKKKDGGKTAATSQKSAEQAKKDAEWAAAVKASREGGSAHQAVSTIRTQAARQTQKADRRAGAEWRGQMGADPFESKDQDGIVLEGQSDFVVTYMNKAGGGRIKATMKGRDVRDIRRKFGDMYFGKKLLSVEPAKAAPKQEAEIEECKSPLGKRRPLKELSA